MHRPKSAVARSARAGITRYLQLYNHLARELADGRFGPDEPLLSEPELVRLHRVSRTTVRRALLRLEEEGRIERRRGSGTYALESREEPPLLLALDELCDLNLKGSRSKTLESGLSQVPRGLQSRHPQLGVQVLTLLRLHCRRGEAFQLDSVYLNKPDCRAADIERVTHEIGAVSADAASARHLRVQAGTALLRMKSEFIGKGNRLLAVTDSVFRSDRASVRADMQRNGQSARWALKRA